MADYSEFILTEIDKVGEIDTLSFARKINVDHQKIVGAVKSLQTHSDVRFVLF